MRSRSADRKRDRERGGPEGSGDPTTPPRSSRARERTVQALEDPAARSGRRAPAPAPRSGHPSGARWRIDGVIPSETGGGGVARHGLNQQINLVAEQLAALSSLNDFRLVGFSVVPPLHRDGIGRPVKRNGQATGRAAQDEIQWTDRRSEERQVVVAGRGVIF